MEYTLDNGACIPKRLHTVVVSVQHDEDVSLEHMKSELKEKIIKVNRCKSLSYLVYQII